MLKSLLHSFIFIFLISLMSCGNVKKENQQAKNELQERGVSGNYVSDGYSQRDEGYDWVAVMVSELTDTLLQVSIRSRADKKQPTCTLDAMAAKHKSDGLFQATIDGNSILFKFRNDSLFILEDPNSGYSNLNFFCSGGASLSGVYTRISTPLDQNQIDKVVFRKYLNYGNYNFLVEVYDKTLTIEPTGLEISNEKVGHQIEGRVVNAEIGDLNIDGFPELLVYIQSDGSGSYGSVIGYFVNNGKSMSQVYLPEIVENDKAKEGYMGHDEFAIVENTFVRRFPIYKPTDPNASPSGGTRQIQYKLTDGEASRIFVVDKIVEY